MISHPMGAFSGKGVYSIYDSESYAATDAYSFVEFVEVISILSFQAWDSGTGGQEFILIALKKFKKLAAARYY